VYVRAIYTGVFRGCFPGSNPQNVSLLLQKPETALKYTQCQWKSPKNKKPWEICFWVRSWLFMLLLSSFVSLSSRMFYARPICWHGWWIGTISAPSSSTCIRETKAILWCCAGEVERTLRPSDFPMRYGGALRLWLFCCSAYQWRLKQLWAWGGRAFQLEGVVWQLWMNAWLNWVCHVYRMSDCFGLALPDRPSPWLSSADPSIVLWALASFAPPPAKIVLSLCLVPQYEQPPLVLQSLPRTHSQTFFLQLKSVLFNHAGVESASERSAFKLNQFIRINK